MALWELPEFLRDRVERGRRLLAEREEYRGSADLQSFIQDMDLTVALHRTFVGEDGQARQGLSERQRLQGLVTFLCSMVCRLTSHDLISIMERASTLALDTETQRLLKLGARNAKSLLGGLGFCSLAILRGKPGDRLFGLAYSVVGDMEWSSCMADAEQLERYQVAQGYDPVLRAAHMRRLILLLQHHVTNRLEKWAANLRATRQLVALDPGSAAYRAKYMVSVVSSPRELGAACHQAMTAAEETNSHYVRCCAGLQLLHMLPSGAQGPQWSLADARGLLGQVKESLALCKAWLPLQVYEPLKRALTEARLILDSEAAKRPGQDLMPSETTTMLSGKMQNGPVETCSGCGQQALTLRKCSACRAVSYCSTACQTQHWKAPGGHRRECAALAASRNA